MKPIATFNVEPALPARLAPLREIAGNLRWSWDPDAITLFRRLDQDGWEAAGHNPVLLLGSVDQDRLETAVADEGFLAHMDRVARGLDEYLAAGSTWFGRTHGPTAGPVAAYFSAEFGLTESLPLFAGGLGVLAGDHLKSSSDLGLPIVGLGLLYRQGYFRQHLTLAGRQHESYEDNDFSTLPVTLVRAPGGAPLTVPVALGGSDVTVQIWRVRVGRVLLYLLDTDVVGNRPEDRAVTYRLYGGDGETRIRQEIVLGIGGVRALAALGLEPSVFHMNEGHSAFLGLERIHRLMQEHRLSFAEAWELVSAGLVFTTHTPVPAGHDRFPADLMERYFARFAAELGLSWRDFLALGRLDARDDREPFGLTVLALRLAGRSNGVSRLHGEVSRRMWQALWPGVPPEEVPIEHVTNGVHLPSWISPEMQELYERHLGPRWREEPADETVWRFAERIPADELWRTRDRRRERLVAFARRRLRAQAVRRNEPPSNVEAAGEALDPKVLTTAFARRFASYKRPSLLFHDPDRLAALMSSATRPMQIIVAGKAHPQDETGKLLIQQISALGRDTRFRGRLIFLEDYDIEVARSLVQGADLWLNTPLRPNEASGTSGMKAAANGSLNLSTLDGWWAEAWERADRRREPVGWVIAAEEADLAPEVRDALEADALYHLLEREVLPGFYERGPDGIPRRWIGWLRSSVTQLCPFVNGHRMVREYAERYYLPALQSYRKLIADGATGARGRARHRARLEAAWSGLAIESVEAEPVNTLRVGTPIRVRALVRLGVLAPEEVRVELYLGRVNPRGEIEDAAAVQLRPVGRADADRFTFEAEALTCRRSGAHGYTVRVRANHDGQVATFVPGLITWTASDTTGGPGG